MIEKLPLCECGCGEKVSKVGNRWVKGHNKGNSGKKASPEKIRRMSESHKGIPMSDAARISNIKAKHRKKDPLPDGWESKEGLMTTNKECSLYLGCFIAEQVLSKRFSNVQVMPPQNYGFDFICNKDMKIDVKSAVKRKVSSWMFNIKQNNIPDYFLLIAFDDRNNLNPKHVWLIPGKILNNLQTTGISEVTISKWSQYEQPIDEVILCCDEMKQSKEDN